MRLSRSKMKSSIAVFLFIMASIMLPTTATAQSDPNLKPAQTACNTRFLTFPAWYRGVVDSSNCEIKSPADVPGGFTGFVWRIGLNIVEIILNLVGYAAVGFIIYGGYKYMISAGSPDGMVAARKTIMNAAIGLVISIAAVAIVNTIAGAI